jgi:transcriptional regulator with XRE-family HTH domain
MLAKKSGFSRRYISLVESGKRMPTLNFIFCMAESFGMNAKDFMILLADKFSDYENMAKKDKEYYCA